MLTRLSFLRRSHLPCSVDYPTRHTWKKKRRRFISVAEEGRKALCDGSSARRTVPGRLGASFLGRAILLLVGGGVLEAEALVAGGRKRERNGSREKGKRGEAGNAEEISKRSRGPVWIRGDVRAMLIMDEDK
jgi:hypothetical protein